MSPPAESRLPAERTCLAGQYSLSITSETHNPQMKPVEPQQGSVLRTASQLLQQHQQEARSYLHIALEHMQGAAGCVPVEVFPRHLRDSLGGLTSSSERSDGSCVILEPASSKTNSMDQEWSSLYDPISSCSIGNMSDALEAADLHQAQRQGRRASLEDGRSHSTASSSSSASCAIRRLAGSCLADLQHIQQVQRAFQAHQQAPSASPSRPFPCGTSRLRQEAARLSEGPCFGLLLDVEAALQTAHDWSWDAFRLAEASQNHALSTLGFWLFQQCSLVDDLGLNPHKLAGYLCRIEAGYRPNPYHNSTHAADVLQSMFKIATSGGLYPGVLDRTGLLCCLLAAIVHDFEHTGLTNDYLINTEHPYALKYNDKAPQENHHVAAAFALLASPEFNFLEGFSRAERTAIRRRVIDMVLATDMKAHMEIMAQFQETLRLPRENRAGWMGRARSRVSASPLVSAFAICAAPATLSAPPESYCNTSIPEHVTLALQMAIKVADVSHLAAAFPVHYRWVKCLEEEFFLQGEHEAAQALPVTRFMDRTQAGVSKSQVGFFEVIALPMFSSFVKVFPDCQPLLDLALANYEDWRGLNNDSEAAWHQRAVVADRKRKRNVTFCQPPTSQLQGSGSHQFPVVRASISRQPTV